jgi:hypothetical protein
MDGPEDHLHDHVITTNICGCAPDLVTLGSLRSRTTDCVPWNKLQIQASMPDAVHFFFVWLVKCVATMWNPPQLLPRLAIGARGDGGLQVSDGSPPCWYQYR